MPKAAWEDPVLSPGVLRVDTFSRHCQLEAAPRLLIQRRRRNWSLNTSVSSMWLLMIQVLPAKIRTNGLDPRCGVRKLVKKSF